jgi:tetratricopeptide (TPR) repeat protein
LAQQGEYDEAIKKYEKALNIDSSLSKIINDLMFTVRELKKTKQKHT